MKKHKCPICERTYISKSKEDEGKYALYDHMELNHKKDLFGLPAAQIYFNYRNKYDLSKGSGKSVISGKPTPFNTVSERYARFLPEEKEKYRELFKKRMKKVYGVETLLTDPEHQKKMLSGRSISGSYKYSDGTEFQYTGSYEEEFLKYLDSIDWPSSDIMAPAMTFEWVDGDGNDRHYIPDFFLSSCSLIVEVKSSDNKHYRLRDLEDEMAKDKSIKNSKFNYLKVYDKKHSNFMDVIDYIRDNPKVKIFKELK